MNFLFNRAKSLVESLFQWPDEEKQPKKQKTQRQVSQEVKPIPQQPIQHDSTPIRPNPMKSRIEESQTPFDIISKFLNKKTKTEVRTITTKKSLNDSAFGTPLNISRNVTINRISDDSIISATPKRKREEESIINQSKLVDQLDSMRTPLMDLKRISKKPLQLRLSALRKKYQEEEKEKEKNVVHPETWSNFSPKYTKEALVYDKEFAKAQIQKKNEREEKYLTKKKREELESEVEIETRKENIVDFPAVTSFTNMFPVEIAPVVEKVVEKPKVVPVVQPVNNMEPTEEFAPDADGGSGSSDDSEEEKEFKPLGDVQGFSFENDTTPSFSLEKQHDQPFAFGSHEEKKECSSPGLFAFGDQEKKEKKDDNLFTFSNTSETVVEPKKDSPKKDSPKEFNFSALDESSKLPFDEKMVPSGEGLTEQSVFAFGSSGGDDGSVFAFGDHSKDQSTTQTTQTTQTSSFGQESTFGSGNPFGGDVVSFDSFSSGNTGSQDNFGSNSFSTGGSFGSSQSPQSTGSFGGPSNFDSFSSNAFSSDNTSTSMFGSSDSFSNQNIGQKRGNDQFKSTSNTTNDFSFGGGNGNSNPSPFVVDFSGGTPTSNSGLVSPNVAGRKLVQGKRRTIGK